MWIWVRGWAIFYTNLPFLYRFHIVYSKNVKTYFWKNAPWPLSQSNIYSINWKKWEQKCMSILLPPICFCGGGQNLTSKFFFSSKWSFCQFSIRFKVCRANRVIQTLLKYLFFSQNGHVLAIYRKGGDRIHPAMCNLAWNIPWHID